MKHYDNLTILFSYLRLRSLFNSLQALSVFSVNIMIFNQLPMSISKRKVRRAVWHYDVVSWIENTQFYVGVDTTEFIYRINRVNGELGLGTGSIIWRPNPESSPLNVIPGHRDRFLNFNSGITVHSSGNKADPHKSAIGNSNDDIGGKQ